MTDLGHRCTADSVGRALGLVGDVTLMQWGDRHLAGPGSPPIR